jgi:hypothetical protein
LGACVTQCALPLWVREEIQALPREGGVGRKAFFSEEKKQRTFGSLSRVYRAEYVQDAKVFWFFFPKKELLAYLRK